MYTHINRFSSLALVFTLLLSTSAEAKEYTLKEIVTIYVNSSSEIKAARSTYMGSYYDKKAAVAKFFPNVSLNGSVTEFENPAISSSSGASITGKKYAGSLDLVQPLFTGGATWNGLSYANLNKALKEQTYLQTKQEAISNILQATLLLGALKEQIQVVEESQKYQERFYKLTQSKVQRGAAKNYELSTAKANYLAYTSKISNLKNQYDNAHNTLKVNLDIDKNETIDFKLPKPTKLEGLDFDKLLEQAVQNRPKLKAAEVSVELAKTAKWLSLAEDLPSASIVGSIGYQSPTQDDFSKDNTKYHSIGVTLKIPLFSGLSSVHKYQSSGESIRVAEETLVTTRNAVRQDVLASLDSLKLANDVVSSTGEWAAEARKALNSSIDSYKNGVVSSVQVIQTQSGWEAAETALINARLSFQTATLNLRKSIGVDLEKIYTEK